MKITYHIAEKEDIASLYQWNKTLIDAYESVETVDYDRILRWIRHKLENHIGEYTVLYADGIKAGYYHFYKNEDDEYEIDDLYIFPEYQCRGIGSTVIEKCCSSVNAPVILYVFSKNERAVALYQRHGFAIEKTIGDSRYIMKRNTSSPMEQRREET